MKLTAVPITELAKAIEEDCSRRMAAMPAEVRQLAATVERMIREAGADQVMTVGDTYRVYVRVPGYTYAGYVADGPTAKRLAETIHQATGLPTLAVAGRHVIRYGGYEIEGEVTNQIEHHA